MRFRDCFRDPSKSIDNVIRPWRKRRQRSRSFPDASEGASERHQHIPPVPALVHLAEHQEPTSTKSDGDAIATATQDPPKERRGSDTSLYTALSSVWDTRPLSTETLKTSVTARTSLAPPASLPPSTPKSVHKKTLRSGLLKPALPQQPPPPLSPSELDDFCAQLIKEPEFIAALQPRTVYSSASNRRSTAGEPLELFLPPLFAAAALCDPKINGLPVRQRSGSFRLPSRGVKVGECEFLNLTHSLADDFSVSMLAGGDGRPTFFLEYKVDMRGPMSSRTSFVLATQMEFTTAIRNLAAHILYCQPGMLRASRRPYYVRKDSGVEVARISVSEAMTKAILKPPKRPKIQISPAPSNWADLAHDMSSLEGVAGHGNVDCSSPSPSPLAEILSTPGAHNAFLTLHELLLDLRYLYRDVLVLRPERQLRHWEIAFASRSLQKTASDLSLCLTASDPMALQRLGQKLSLNERCTEIIRWGAVGKACRLYCIPMDGPRTARQKQREQWWVCWLVDAKVPELW